MDIFSQCIMATQVTPWRNQQGYGVISTPNKLVYIHSFTPGLDFTLEVALIQCLRAHSCLFWIDRLPSPDEATTSTVTIF